MDLVLIWWIFISVAGFFQTLFALRLFINSKHKIAPLLCLIYASVCWFRSVLPRMDVERLCMWDYTASWIVFGRSAAFVAEVSFGVLLSLTFKDSTMALCLTIANLFCWAGVLTRNNLFHCIEESIWGLIGLYLFVRYRQKMKLLWLALPFALYMALIDVPMYFRKWNAFNGTYLSVVDGFFDMCQCSVISRDSSVWIQEMYWMTPYFTVAVWFSIYLAITINSPSKQKRK